MPITTCFMPESLTLTPRSVIRAGRRQANPPAGVPDGRAAPHRRRVLLRAAGGPQPSHPGAPCALAPVYARRQPSFTRPALAGCLQHCRDSSIACVVEFCCHWRPQYEHGHEFGSHKHAMPAAAFSSADVREAAALRPTVTQPSTSLSAGADHHGAVQRRLFDQLLL